MKLVTRMIPYAVVVAIACWAVTVGWRVIHTRAKRYLLSNAFLMIVWLAARWLKWEFVENADIDRQLWYLYYLSMLMIPMLCLSLAVSLGRPDSYRPPLILKVCFAITGSLVLFVLLNDFHQWVFSFPADAVVWTDYDYRYEAGYFVVVGWGVLCGLLAFWIMIQKTRRLKNKKMLSVPILSFGFLFLYATLYDLRLIPKIFILNDMTLIFCLCIIATLEGCIQSGLIPSNSHYAELFQLSAIDGQIADERFQVQLAANRSEPLTEDMVRRVVSAGRVERMGEGNEHIYLVAAPLKRGYMLWKEDVSEISEIIAELADKSEYLTARRNALRKEVEAGRREQQLVEKNRLYHALMDETKDEVNKFAELLDSIERTEDASELQKLTQRLALICTHIKRRSNLIFLAEENQCIKAEELRYAVEEWISNLRPGGIICGGLFEMQTPIALSHMLFLYDAFQDILLYALNTLKSLFVNCSEEEGKMTMLVTLTCGEDFSCFAVPGVDVVDEDGDEKVLEVALPAAPFPVVPAGGDSL